MPEVIDITALPAPEVWRVPSATLRGRQGGNRNSKQLPILILHGLGSDMDHYRLLWPALAARRTCFAYDHPGHGPMGHEIGEPRIAHLSQVAAEVIEHKAGGQVDLVASSMGGLVAVHLMAHYPKLVRKAALLAPAGSKRGDQRLAALTSGLGNLAHWPLIQGLYLTAIYRHHITQPLPEELNMKQWRAWYFKKRTLLNLEDQTRNFFLTMSGILKASGLVWARMVEQEVLILQGTKDALVNHEHMEGYLNAMAHARLEILEGATHNLATSYHREVGEHLSTFFD